MRKQYCLYATKRNNRPERNYNSEINWFIHDYKSLLYNATKTIFTSRRIDIRIQKESTLIYTMRYYFLPSITILFNKIL